MVDLNVLNMGNLRKIPNPGNIGINPTLHGVFLTFSAPGRPLNACADLKLGMNMYICSISKVMKFKHRISFRTEVIQDRTIGGGISCPPCNVGLRGRKPRLFFDEGLSNFVVSYWFHTIF